jgi:hypothetical protein
MDLGKRVFCLISATAGGLLLGKQPKNWVLIRTNTKPSRTAMIHEMPSWTPTPGNMATYVGRTKALTRNVIVIAEAVPGRMIDTLVQRVRSVAQDVTFTPLQG